jgi:UDP-2,3-diacylglucosamine hydrolase
MASIEAACRDSQLIILGGDIFDFRWATLGGHLATLRAGRCWLNDLLKKNSHARVVYILGNHDSHPDMQELLDDVAAKSHRLEWYAESYQVADCLFCHGDILDAGGRAGLADYRRKFHDERPASRAAHHAYEVAVAMRLHRTIPTLFHRPRATCAKLSELLQLSPQGDHAPVQRVFFGHTHVPIYELPLGSIQFFNPGAALRHLNFAPITFEVDSD